jgi:glycine cleavage system H protein
MKYTATHEWVVIESGKQAIVGITQHAQKELGEIVYVQLPQIGSELKAGEEVAVLESTKAAADIYSPLSGVITEINEELLENIDRLNEEPEKRGWLFKIKPTKREELEQLLEKVDYEALIL